MLDILIEVVFRAVCFPLGWPIMRLITWGKYPSNGSWLAHTPESEWTSGAGVTVLLVGMMAALKQFIFP